MNDPDVWVQRFEQESPGSPTAFRLVAEQMQRWGQTMPTHVTRRDRRSLGASSEDPTDYPPAPPAAEAGIRLLAEKGGRPIRPDGRQLCSLADRGLGPGIGDTDGFRPGLYPLERIGPAYDVFLGH